MSGAPTESQPMTCVFGQAVTVPANRSAFGKQASKHELTLLGQVSEARKPDGYQHESPYEYRKDISSNNACHPPLGMV